MEEATKLRSLVEAVRSELEYAKMQATSDGVKFNVKRIELELQFTVREEADVGGGIRTWLFDFGASARAGSAVVQTLTLELTPEWIDESKKSGDLLIRSVSQDHPLRTREGTGGQGESKSE